MNVVPEAAAVLAAVPADLADREALGQNANLHRLLLTALPT